MRIQVGGSAAIMASGSVPPLAGTSRNRPAVMRASQSPPPRTRSRTTARPLGTSITSGSYREASASIPTGMAPELGVAATATLLTYHGSPPPTQAFRRTRTK